jgi:hypothetical protein
MGLDLERCVGMVVGNGLDERQVVTCVVGRRRGGSDVMAEVSYILEGR